jgi:hypothetical protein
VDLVRRGAAARDDRRPRRARGREEGKGEQVDRRQRVLADGQVVRARALLVEEREAEVEVDGRVGLAVCEEEKELAA